MTNTGETAESHEALRARIPAPSVGGPEAAVETGRRACLACCDNPAASPRACRLREVLKRLRPGPRPRSGHRRGCALTARLARAAERFCGRAPPALGLRPLLAFLSGGDGGTDHREPDAAPGGMRLAPLSRAGPDGRDWHRRCLVPRLEPREAAPAGSTRTRRCSVGSCRSRGWREACRRNSRGGNAAARGVLVVAGKYLTALRGPRAPRPVGRSTERLADQTYGPLTYAWRPAAVARKTREQAAGRSAGRSQRSLESTRS